MIQEAQVKKIVRQVVERTLKSNESANQRMGESTNPRATHRPAETDRPQRRRVVSEEEVRATPPGQTINVPPDALVTPLARALARERRVVISNQPSVGSKQAAEGQRAWDRVVAIGADHGGFELKVDLRAYLKELGYLVQDCGTGAAQPPVDYPDFALAVASAVASGECWRGVMVDGAGIGSCMTANKVPGVRAAMCYDLASAKNSREHNDANLLTLGGRMISKETARQIVKAFLETDCSEERHLKRVQKIMDVERRFLRR